MDNKGCNQFVLNAFYYAKIHRFTTLAVVTMKILLLIPMLCAGSALFAQYNSDNLTVKSEVAETQFSYDKLRIYPITANRVFIEAHKSMGNFTPLKTALADGTVKIIEHGALATMDAPDLPDATEAGVSAYEESLPPTELTLTDPAMQPAANHQDANGHVIRREEYNQRAVDAQVVYVEPVIAVQSEMNFADEADNVSEEYSGSASDQVNTLYIQNTSNDSVFIMAGEVVKGGKQDRVIAMDMVIPPHSDAIDLSVFCVEHGRWTYGDGETSAADGFTSQAAVANTSVRRAAIVEKDQSMVWSKVEEVTSANDAASETGTLNALEQSTDYQKELEAYLTKFADLPRSSASVIGVVAVTGNRVIGCDMFATPDLLRNAFPDLLKSYASEAITSGAKVSIGKSVVDKYIANILEESKQAERVQEKGQMYKRGARTMHISTF